jgi:hypothetical protein
MATLESHSSQNPLLLQIFLDTDEKAVTSFLSFYHFSKFNIWPLEPAPTLDGQFLDWLSLKSSA